MKFTGAVVAVAVALVLVCSVAMAKKEKGGIVNINTADATELQKLQGVGPKMAEKIIEKRTELGGKFSSIEDLRKVKGIGEKTFDKMKDQLTIGAEKPAEKAAEEMPKAAE